MLPEVCLLIVIMQYVPCSSRDLGLFESGTGDSGMYYCCIARIEDWNTDSSCFDARPISKVQRPG